MSTFLLFITLLNTHADLWFTAWFTSCFTTLLKSRICCIFSEHVLLRTPLKCCFCSSQCSLLIYPDMSEKVCFFAVFSEIKKGTLGRNGRSSHQKCSIKKGVLKNFTKFKGRQLCQSLFFNKTKGLRQLY